MEIYRASGTDYSYVERELRSAGYLDGDNEHISDALVALLAVLDGRGLDLEDRTTVSQLFTTLVKKDGSLGSKAGPRSVWKQFYLGTFPYGSTVRVKPDAYDTPAGSRHNGLTGLFSSAKAGRASVQYHGRHDGSGHEHAPDKLQILWKGGEE